MDKNIFINSLGPFPEKCDLNAKVIERVEFEEYIQEKVQYQAEENELISAYLLIPKNIKEKTPAIFCHHQHASNFSIGKSETVGLSGDPNQFYAKELALKGYITFAPDAIAFEERNWDTESHGSHVAYFELATRLVMGQTLLAKVLHDISAGLDYLETRPEINKECLGFIGHSYGGRMAIWAPAFDDRIKASVSNCGCINFKDSINRNAGIQMEFCVPNIMSLYDVEDIVKLIEPNSLFISATEDDKWSKGAKEIYNYAKDSFKKGRLKLKVWPGQHVFTKDMREEAYIFLDKYLK